MNIKQNSSVRRSFLEKIPKVFLAFEKWTKINVQF
jgi:hypothetical protein